MRKSIMNPSLLSGSRAKISSVVVIVVLFLSVVAVGAGAGLGGYGAATAIAATISGLAALLTCLTNKRLALYVLIASLPLGGVLRYSPVASSLLVVPGAFAFLAWIAALAVRRAAISAHLQTIVPAFLLGVWCVFSAIYNGGSPWIESRPYVLVILLAFLIPNMFHQQRDLLVMSWVLALSLGATGLYVVILRLLFSVGSGGPVSAMALHVAALKIGDKNVIGMDLALAIPLAFYMQEFYRKQPRKRVWLWLCGGAGLAGALATISIGTFVGLCVDFMVIMWLQEKNGHRLQTFVIALAMVLLALASPLYDRLQAARGTQVGSAQWANYRMTTWVAAWTVFIDHPIWGLGPSVSRVAAAMLPSIDPAYQKILLRVDRADAFVPHNIFLSVATQTGLVGLVLYCTMLGATFYVLRQTMNTLNRVREKGFMLQFGKILIVGLVALLVQGIGLSEHLNKYLWLFVGCAGAYATILARHVAPAKGWVRRRGHAP